MRDRFLIFVLLILLVTACGGGGGSELIYKAAGTASRAKVEYKNAKGETETETVTLPWETTLDIGGDFSFKINVYNESQDGTVTCAVWINEQEVGDTTGDTSAGCVGSFSGDSKSYTWSFSSYHDTASQETSPEPTEEPAKPTAAPADTPAAPVPTLAPITDFERYEHDRDCSGYDSELKLRAFAVLYPSGALIEDCSENPDNYVVFSLDPGGDTEDPAFVLGLGKFNASPPDQASYVSNSMRLLSILTSQIESQYGGETLDSAPIVYQEVRLSHEDFIAKVEGTSRLMRMVAVPNFDHGHGVLFFAMQKVGDDYEQALPEFDRVSRELIASIEFPAVEPTIGSIAFAGEVTDDDEAVNPATSFPAGILQVFGVFEYTDILPGMEFGYAWYFNGEQVLAGTSAWDDESAGKTWVSIDHPDGLSAGDYELQLSLGGELLQTGSFVVESSSEGEMDAIAWHDRSIELYDQGEYQEALTAVSKSIELDPNYVFAYNSRALVLVELGDYEQAMADLNYALELDSNYAEAYNSRGEIYRIQGDIENAIADFDRTIALSPDYALAYSNRGRAYRIQGDLDRALADSNQAVELDPELDTAYFNRGVIYYLKEEFDLAIADYDQTIVLNPAYPVAYLNRGVVYYVQGELDLAIADFGQAIELWPDYDQAYLNRGISYADQGDAESAIADFRKVLEVSDNPNLRQAAEERLEALGAEP